MKKRASALILTAGGQVLGRIADNLMVHGLVKKVKGFHRDVLGNFIHGRDVSIGRNAAIQGLRSSVVPDSRVLELEARNYRPIFNKICMRAGWNPNNLTRRQIVTLRRILRGNFAKAIGTRNKENIKLVSHIISTVGQHQPISPNVVQKILNDPAAIKQLELAWQKNKFLGNIGRGLADQINSKTLTELAANNKYIQNLPNNKGLIISSGTRNAAEAYGDLAMGFANPTTPVTNMATRLINSEAADKFIKQDLSNISWSSPRKILQKGIQIAKKVTDENPRQTAITNGMIDRAYIPKFIPDAIANNPIVDKTVNNIRTYTTDLPTASVNQFNNQTYRLASKIKDKVNV